MAPQTTGQTRKTIPQGSQSAAPNRIIKTTVVTAKQHKTKIAKVAEIAKSEEKKHRVLNRKNEEMDCSFLSDDPNLEGGVLSETESEMLATPQHTNKSEGSSEDTESYSNQPLESGANHDSVRSQRPPLSAELDLSNSNCISQILGDNRILHVTSLQPGSPLSKLNPILLCKFLEQVSGGVKLTSIKHLKSGSLIVTCSSMSQVQDLFTCKEIKLSAKHTAIPIKFSLAKIGQTVSGKLYASELSDLTLEELLIELKPSGVYQVRKMLSDPRKSHVPLYLCVYFFWENPSNAYYLR